MLNELHIENIAVIERCDISFDRGLIILTGETGAGKSIIIDALNAVLGNRTSKDIVRHGADHAVVSAVFSSNSVDEWLADNDIPSDEELILQRKISKEGKSSCRINGIPVTAAQLHELGGQLVDIHGQNDGMRLLDERMHLDFLDRFAEDAETLEAYRKEYSKYSEITREIRSLSMDEDEKSRLSDTLKFRIDELEKADLKNGEFDTLCARRDLLRNSEKLSEALDEAYASLYGDGEENAAYFLQNAAAWGEKAARFAPELEKSAGALSDALFAVSDAAETFRDFRSSLDFSPEEYDSLESRISLLNRLQRKYAKDEDELISYLLECKEKLDSIEYSEDRLVRLNKDLQNQKKICRKKADELTKARKTAAESLRIRIEKELSELNMPSVHFVVDIQPQKNEDGFDSDGADCVAFLMSANTGELPGKISKIASGGELSRIMLALKNVFAEHDIVETLIFDEIDTGVSGVSALRVAEKLYSVSKNRQVMCVTHLPQLAAMGDSQYLVSKTEHSGRTYTEVSHLSLSGREKEISRLFGGDFITDTTLAAASEQLKAAQFFKDNN